MKNFIKAVVISALIISNSAFADPVPFVNVAIHPFCYENIEKKNFWVVYDSNNEKAGKIIISDVVVLQPGTLKFSLLKREKNAVFFLHENEIVLDANGKIFLKGFADLGGYKLHGKCSEIFDKNSILNIILRNVEFK